MKGIKRKKIVIYLEHFKYVVREFSSLEMISIEKYLSGEIGLDSNF